MSKLIIIILFLLPGLAFADFIASAGLQGGTLETGNMSPEGKPLVKSSFFGLKGEIEFGFPYLTFFGSIDYGRGSGKTQYNYEDPDDSSTTGTAENLKTTIGITKLSGGMRLKIIKLKHFRLYVGGGYQVGSLSVVFDKEDFKKINDDTDGFEEEESQRFKGGFAEAGMEIIFDENSGIKISAQRSSLKTEKFLTLGDEKLNLNTTAFLVNYIEYIETGSW